MHLSKSTISSGFITFLKSKTASSSLVKNTPGESISYTFESRIMYWRFLVCPGYEETLTPFLFINEFIKELLPTFGYPTIPTVTLVFIPLCFE